MQTLSLTCPLSLLPNWQLVLIFLPALYSFIFVKYVLCFDPVPIFHFQQFKLLTSYHDPEDKILSFSTFYVTRHYPPSSSIVTATNQKKTKKKKSYPTLHVFSFQPDPRDADPETTKLLFPCQQSEQQVLVRLVILAGPPSYVDACSEKLQHVDP